MRPWVSRVRNCEASASFRDLEQRGHYLVAQTSEWGRVATSLNQTSGGLKLATTRGTGDTNFRADAQPEQVKDGERNYRISQVYLKLKWHGCTLATATRIVDSYVMRMPGADASSSVERHKEAGASIYRITRITKAVDQE